MQPGERARPSAAAVPKRHEARAEHEEYLGSDPVFVTHYRGRGERLVVVVPPLFEELSRARKVLVNLSRALSDDGLDVVRFDYYGTGLSEGDFADFSLERAYGDLERVIDHFSTPRMPRPALVGMRFGGWIATSPRLRERIGTVVVWEPVVDLRAYLREMLRIEVSNQMISLGEVRRSQADLEAALRNGRSVLIDGYCVSPLLYAQLVAAADTESRGAERLRGASAVALFWDSKPIHEAAASHGVASAWIDAPRFSYRHIRHLDPRPRALIEKTRKALGGER
jgi:alpha/beta superfamily hydrolase